MITDIVISKFGKPDFDKAINDAAIAAMGEQFLALTIDGLKDRDGYQKVHESRMLVKNTRVAVEKRRKDLKEDALNYGRQVDAEAKRLTALLEPIEAHLEAEQSRIDAEKENIRKAEEEKKQAAINGRIEILAGYGRQGDLLTLAVLPDAEFEAEVAKSKTEFEASQAQKAEEEKLKKEESERLARVAEEQAQERARLEAMAKEQEQKQADIKRQEEAIAEEKARIKAAEDAKIAEAKRQEELDQARKQAAEKAKAEAELEAKLKSEKEAKELRLAKEKTEAEERLRPDREKLAAFAMSIKNLSRPVLASEEAGKILADAEVALAKVCAALRKGK